MSLVHERVSDAIGIFFVIGLTAVAVALIVLR